MKRYNKLDGIRGFTLLSMILYHGMWDLVYLFGVSAPWYRGTPGFYWQQSICFTFIILSGFCWPLGKRHLKRGLTVFLSGVLVSFVTVRFMPEAAVRFGVLTLIGSAMLILIPLSRLLKKVPAAAGLLLSILLFAVTRWAAYGYLGQNGLWRMKLPEGWYANYFTAYLGFPPKDFSSTDYFPLIPWLFLFLSGYYLYHCLLFGRRRLPKFLEKGWLKPIEWMGRHSLIIYLLHQPVIYGLCLLFSRLRSFPLL